MSKTITVGINTDTFNEINESFLINLDTVSNAVIVKSQARTRPFLMTIRSHLSITDASSNEGANRNKSLYDLHLPSWALCTKRQNGIGSWCHFGRHCLKLGADPSADYVPWNGIINFLPGETSKSISVLVKGISHLRAMNFSICSFPMSATQP